MLQPRRIQLFSADAGARSSCCIAVSPGAPEHARRNARTGSRNGGPTADRCGDKV